MYDVRVDGEVDQQVAALPGAALAAFAELRVSLEVAPWSGDPYCREKPDGPLRVRTFGDAGQVVYLVLERERRVDVLMVQWAG